MHPNAAVIRHLISHPADSAYGAAKHLRLPTRKVQRLCRSLNWRAGATDATLLRRLASLGTAHRELCYALDAPSRWLARPAAPVSLSGEDAAAVEGLPIVPHRHLWYVAEEDVSLIDRDLRGCGAEPVGRDEANAILRVRDPWLMDEPAPLVERGQRLLDYLESSHPALRRSVSLGP